MSDEKKFDVCAHCCDWCHEMEGRSPATVRDTYPKMIRKVLKRRFYMGKRAAGEFVGTDSWSGACHGNWDRLHETGAEKCLTAKNYAEMLVDEVWYFSDRWSWDRLLRAQWIYQRLRDRCERES